ncbi:hypothetical protein J4G37_32080, partial [Microvirga sp. 3-52]|nr:hypothetical protein [Microvirga sp. 3-52]
DHLPPTLFLRCCGQLAHVHMFHPADLGRLAANFKITQAGSISSNYFITSACGGLIFLLPTLIPAAAEASLYLGCSIVIIASALGLSLWRMKSLAERTQH